MASARKKEASSSYFGLRKSTEKVQITSVHDESQEAMRELLQEVFGCQSADDPSKFVNWSLNAADVHLDTELRKLEQLGSLNVNWSGVGRIGPDRVVFEKISSTGNMLIEPDQLEVYSKSNFSTIRANCCVYKGKWMYECLLGTKGIMQLGWSTANCKFSQEEGVGDTADSYAYDGNRVRIWNVQTYHYGQAWLTGDVIGILLDCDKRTITFYRNGQCMGDAFTTVRFGPELAYFPSVSLSGGENLRVNFGSTSFRYPVEGYQPLEAPCYVELIKARHLFAYWDTLVHKWVGSDMSSGCSKSDDNTTPSSTTIPVDKRSTKATLLLVSDTLIHRIAPLLKKESVIDECLLGLLEKYCKNTMSQQYIHTTLDIFWTLLQDFEISKCLESLTIALLSSYRYSQITPTFIHQITYLKLLYYLVTHKRTRHFLLENIFFDKVKLDVFLYIKPPDDEGLKELVPVVWWAPADKHADVELSEDEKERKEAYQKSCERLRNAVSVLEDLQVEIMKILLIDDDNNGECQVSSRYLFMRKCREFLKENMQTNHRLQLPVVLCLFHRLSRAARYYCDLWYESHKDTAMPSHALFIPGEWFSNSSLQYFKHQRLGGTMVQLKRKLKAEAINPSTSQLSSSPVNRSLSANIEEFFTRFSFGSQSSSISRDEEDDKGSGDVFFDKSSELSQEMPTSPSLLGLVDDVIILFHLAAHKQLNKMCGLRDSLDDYIVALEESKKKCEECPDELPDVKVELENAYRVFEGKVEEQARQMSWIISVIYSKDKQEDVFWVLDVALSSLLEASNTNYFVYVPELYVETCTKSYSALIHCFHPTTSKDSLQRFPEVLHRFADFLVSNFSNANIISHDIKDTITQALACFVCYPQSLRALETLPEEKCKTLVKTLLSYYETYSWAHTNSIIVRIWKGCGFGFRYKHLPDVVPVKHIHSEMALAKLQDVCPSMVLQHHIGQVLRSDVDGSAKLMDTILNQLNWTFSECCGHLQKLRDRCLLRPGVSLLLTIDPHHVSLIATCFYTAVSLIRLVEMVVHLCPEVLTDWQRSSAELLLCRLFQLLTQILSRMTSKSNVFDAIGGLRIPGLETLGHFPILTGVAGVLIQLILHGDPKSQQCATAALLSEPGFEIRYLEWLIGRREDEVSMKPGDINRPFSFLSYSEVSEGEIQEMEMLIVFLQSQMKDLKEHQKELDEDLLCEICYAREQSVQFQPCKHQSCRSCINHHMLTQKTCFFCKATVKHLTDINPSTASTKKT